jgi:hypothetical protein
MADTKVFSDGFHRFALPQTTDNAKVPHPDRDRKVERRDNTDNTLGLPAFLQLVVMAVRN